MTDRQDRARGISLGFRGRSVDEEATHLRRLYMGVSFPFLSMMPASKRDCRNSSGVICLTSSTIFLRVRVIPLVMRSAGSASAVSAIGSDVPDREDVFLVADADLDVRFFINPAPLGLVGGDVCETVDLQTGDLRSARWQGRRPCHNKCLGRDMSRKLFPARSLLTSPVHGREFSMLVNDASVEE